MKLKQIMLAAPKSGSGKTMMVCALLQALKDRGQQVVSYKCGPDYIDPMFHKKVMGIPSKNLDTFFTGEEKTKALFLQGRTEKDFAVLEGVMGLFDGLGGIREEGSSYHLAEITKTPILLVVDAKGMGQSLLPLITGFLAYDKAQLIKGILLNRTSKAYYERIKPLIEKELNICVVGYFPEYREFTIESRHLGLLLPEEYEDIHERLQAVSQEFQRTVSVDDIMRIAAEAEELEKAEEIEEAGELERAEEIHEAGELTEGSQPVRKEQTIESKGAFCVPYKKMAACTQAVSSKPAPIIAVAQDEAFCFYYEDNLSLLQEMGAKLTFFSPIHDKKLPSGCGGLLLGGGYPELYAKALSQNHEMLAEIKNAINGGMPTVAECGGFLYLHSVLIDKEGNHHAMAGVLPSVCRYTGKSVRFGYIELTEKENHFLPKGESIKGHEFHYFDSEDNGNGCVAVKPVTGKSYDCTIVSESCFLGFAHLYYPSNPAFAQNFVEKVKAYE